MRVHFLAHMPRAGIGNIEYWARERSHTLTGTNLHEQIIWPKLSSFDLLVVLGGNPEECEAWLQDEIEFIKESILAGKKVLGICLGSQLLAEALGGKLVPHTHSESGWLPVLLNDAGTQSRLLKGVANKTPLYFFHRNTFILPETCILLGSTEACRNQIFSWNDQVLGFQAHPEMLPETMEYLWKHKSTALPTGEHNKMSEKDSEELMKIIVARQFMFRVLDNLVNA
ncbi:MULTISPECIES: type 1 glutamine amidotransferase [Pseudomonas]|uniref:Glutamine amidotransferase domain-containing protein n=1 Tax=Pseudomonas putida TaxID=303 RepID=A0A2S3XCJ0_PSEPU|nr:MULTISPECIES: type 1 glutamine amidotransferase [Pseudomonas]PTC01759.1 type 1 glutamine amidotransferase [Thalassospira xiamenensis]AVD83770.1 amidotransferase [Pseudomonas sp. SWI6]AVD95060.1 amidotransferase [Pseudomonas sp. SWI36]ELU0814303.1 type 1 glutamine amidotransferase [Pseudomonas putida]MBH3388643.1 type 1 glutamine amidotransferase [Pseudomonas putida]